MQHQQTKVTNGPTHELVHRWQSRLYCHECGATMRADEVKCTTCAGYEEKWPLVVNGRKFQ